MGKVKKRFDFMDSFMTLQAILFDPNFDISSDEVWDKIVFFSHEAILNLFIYYPTLLKALNKYNNLDLFKLTKKELILHLRKVITGSGIKKATIPYFRKVKQEEFDSDIFKNLAPKESALLKNIIDASGDMNAYNSMGYMYDKYTKKGKKSKKQSNKQKYIDICNRMYNVEGLLNFFNNLSSEIVYKFQYIYGINISPDHINISADMDDYSPIEYNIDNVYIIINSKLSTSNFAEPNSNNIYLSIKIKNKQYLDKITEYIVDVITRRFNLHSSQVYLIGGHDSASASKAHTNLGYEFEKHRIYGKPGEFLGNGLYSIKIPSKYYSDDYHLLDIQKSKYNLLYIFRGRDGKKHILKTNSFNYYYRDDHGSKSYPVLNANKVNAYVFDFHNAKNIERDYRNYETGWRPAIRHFVDFFYIKTQNKIQRCFEDIGYKVGYWDIETDTRIHIDLNDTENQAKAPITYISYINTDMEKHIFIYDDRSRSYTDRKDIHIHYFNNEEEMLKAFLTLVVDIDCPDIMTGWNVYFDTTYTHTRCRLMYPKLLKIFEKFGPVDFYRNKKRRKEDITWPGFVVIDMQSFYKKQVAGEKEAWNLAYTSNDLFGEDDHKYNHLIKKTMPNPNASIDEWIDYNLTDGLLLPAIDEEANVIGFRNMLRIIAKSPWNKITEMSYNVKTYLLHRYKTKGEVLRNIKVNRPQVKQKGGFNQYTTAGIYELVSDLDAKAMYPSLMRNYNIGWDTFVAKIPHDLAFDIIFDKVNEDRLNEEITFDWMPFICDFQGNIETRTNTIGNVIKWIKSNNLVIAFNGGIYQSHSNKLAGTFEILNYLIKTRDEIKAKVIDDEGNVDKILDDIQKTLKAQANSFYGVMGFKNFELSHGDLINSVTYSGRFYIKAVMIMVDYYITEKIANSEFDVDSIKMEDHHERLYNIDLIPQNNLSHLKYVKYADSVAGDSEILIRKNNNISYMNINELFTSVDRTIGDKEYCYLSGVETITITDSGQIIWKNVPYIMRHKINSKDKKMYRIWNNNTTYLDVTEDHSVFTYLPKYKKSKVSNVGQRFIETKPNNLEGKSLITYDSVINNKVEVNKDSLNIWELAGFLIGDGYWGGNSRNSKYYCSLSSGIDAIEIKEKLLDNLKSIKFISNYYDKNDKGDISILGTKLCKFMEAFKINKRKIIPKFMFKLSADKIRAFLRGLFSADGTVIINKRGGIEIRLANTNQDIINDTRKLLYLIGIPNTTITQNIPNTYNGVKTGTFTKFINIKNKKRFMDDVGFILDRKTERLDDIKTRKSNKNFSGEFDLLSIKNVEEIEYNDYVYDIEVEDTHKFFANYILVHNTDGCMIFFREITDNPDEIYPYLKDINHLVNDIVIPYIYKLCNIEDNPQYHFMRFKDEWIAGRIVLYEEVAKKYAAWITRKHGKVVDELEIRKNILPVSIPRIPRERLRVLISDYILKCKKFDIDKMYEYINGVTEEFEKMVNEKSSKIAKPINQSRLIEQYDKKNFLPFHINGCAWYNILIDEVFTGFKRGYVYKIKGFNEALMPEDIRRKYIEFKQKNFTVQIANKRMRLRPTTFSVPVGEKCPQWVILNREEIINSIWTTRYEDIVSPLIKVTNEELDFEF